MIGGSILAAWIPFWTFLSALSTVDFMRTSTGQPSIGTMFLPVGISSGFTVLGISVMVLAFVRLAGTEKRDTQSPRVQRNIKEERITRVAIPVKILTSEPIAPLQPAPAKTTPPFGAIMKLPDGRQVLTCEQGDIAQIYLDNTVDQCSRILVGKCLKFSGRIKENLGNGKIYLEYVDGPLISLEFGNHWIESLATLGRGSSLTIRGRVSNVNQASIRFDNCEIL